MQRPRLSVKEVIGSCLSSGDVFECCLRVVKTEPVLSRDHLCPYQHDELEHVYFQLVFRFFLTEEAWAI